MIMQIDLSSAVPIYQQIRTVIISAIGSGHLKSGDELPSVRQMAVDLGVNMHTVNKAYNLLKSDGYILMTRRGAFVSSTQSASGAVLDRISELISNAAIEAAAKGISIKDFLNECEKSYIKAQGGSYDER